MHSIPITGLVASSPAAWASTGRHIVIPFGRVLRVFDVTLSTPKCIASLQGHSAPVVSVASAGNMRVASASEDGTVRVWDIIDGACLRTIDVGQEISAMCKAGSEKFVCIGARGVFLVSLSKQRKSIIRNLFASKSLKSGLARAASPANGTFVAIVHSNFLQLRSIAKGEEGRAVLVKHNSLLTSVAVSSDGSVLAAGDESGAIFVYPNPILMLPRSPNSVQLHHSKTSCSKLHWHSSPVRGLSFSQDGTTLVSGAAEAVLVTWKMTRNHFGTRTFLPRLRGPILAISFSNDESTCALTQADNSVRLINPASNAITSTIRGIRASIADFEPFIHKRALSSRISRESSEVIGMTRDPRQSGQVLISGAGGEIQCFDLCKGQHVSDITVIPRNVINEPKKHGKPAKCPDPVEVTHVKMDPSGEYMVTIDQQCLSTRSSEEFNIESTVTTLRFWKTSRRDEAPSLISVFRQPHGVGAAVSCVCFHPQIPLAVTTSPNGKFKLWREVRGVKQGREVVWRSEVELGYKGLPCTSACFSNDGSVLGVACGSVLTMWHIEDMVTHVPAEKIVEQAGYRRPELDSPSSLRVELLHALVHPPAEEAIQSVSFTSKQFPLFITVTEVGIYVWNALTQGIWWSSRIRTVPRTIATDERSGLFALAVKIPTLLPVAEDSHNDGANGIRECTAENDDHTKANTLRNVSVRTGERPADKDLHGSNKVRKGSEGAAKRGRPKRKHGALSKPEPHDQRGLKWTCPMDSAIALFDTASPYPLRISRLPTGVDVTSLEFIAGKRGEEESQPRLVCVDSNLEVGFYGTSGNDEEELSFLTNPTSLGARVEVSPSESVRKLDSLLDSSPDELDELNTWSDGSRLSAAGLPITKPTSELSHKALVQRYAQASLMGPLRDYFHGPVHIQAPVSAKSFDFINAILCRDKDTTDDNTEEADREMPPSGDKENPVDMEHSRAPLEKGLEVVVDQYKARWDVCRELVASHHENITKPQSRKR